jgi:hypothetical protein
MVVSARITEDLLQALNVRLKVDGYQNIGQLLRDYSTYKFPKYSKDEQVDLDACFCSSSIQSSNVLTMRLFLIFLPLS